MTRKEEVFTAFEGFSIMCIACLFHVFSGALPELTKACGTSAWIALLLSWVFSLCIFFIFCHLLRLYEGKDLLGIIRAIFGPVFSKIIVLCLFLFFLLYTTNNLFEAVNLLANNTYAHTRNISLAMAFLAVAWIISMYPIKGLSRTASVAIFLFLGSIAFILIMSYHQYDATFLNPILGYGWGPIAKMGFMQISNTHGVLLMALFAKSYGGTKYFRKSGFWAVMVAYAAFFFSAFFYSMSAPYQTTLFSRAGLLDLAQSIYINRFFQRFESIFIIFVSMGKILVIALGMVAVKRLYAELFSIKPKHQKAVVFPMALLVLAINQLMVNMPVAGERIDEFISYGGAYFTVIFIAVLLIGAWIHMGFGRGKRAAKAICLLLACTFIAGTLSGCDTKITEPDEEIFAVIMGYDRSDPETLRITMKMMPEDKNSAGGSGGGAFPDQEGAGGSGVPDNVFTVDAPCNIPAADLINTVIPKHISLLHVKMLVISEELATEDIDMLITPIIRYNEIKSTIAVIICDGTAEEYIAANTSELIPFLPLETEMVLKQNKGNASYMVKTMGDIYQTFTGNYGDAVAMYGGLTKEARLKREIAASKPEEDGEQEESGATGKSDSTEDSQLGGVEKHTTSEKDAQQSEDSGTQGGSQSGYTYPDDDLWEIGGDPFARTGDGEVPYVFIDDPTIGYHNGYLPGEIPIKTAVEVQIAGMAVMRENRMVGKLDTSQTKAFMLASGDFNGSVMTVRDPYKPDFYVIYYAYSRKKPRIKATVDEEGKAHIDVETFVQAELAIVQNTEPNYQELEERTQLREYTEAYLQQEIDQLVYTLQTVYQSDALQLGRYVSKNFRTIQEWEEYDWRSRYPEAEINVNVNLKL